jgi:hypothetical protein
MGGGLSGGLMSKSAQQIGLHPVSYRVNIGGGGRGGEATGARG